MVVLGVNNTLQNAYYNRYSSCKDSVNNISFKGFSKLPFEGARDANLVKLKYDAFAEAERKFNNGQISKDQLEKYKKAIESYYDQAAKTSETDFSSDYFKRNEPKLINFKGNLDDSDVSDVESIDDDDISDGSIIDSIFDFLDDLL